MGPCFCSGRCCNDWCFEILTRITRNTLGAWTYFNMIVCLIFAKPWSLHKLAMITVQNKGRFQKDLSGAFIQAIAEGITCVIVWLFIFPASHGHIPSGCHLKKPKVLRHATVSGQLCQEQEGLQVQIPRHGSHGLLACTESLSAKRTATWEHHLVKNQETGARLLNVLCYLYSALSGGLKYCTFLILTYVFLLHSLGSFFKWVGEPTNIQTANLGLTSTHTSPRQNHLQGALGLLAAGPNRGWDLEDVEDMELISDIFRYHKIHTW